MDRTGYYTTLQYGRPNSGFSTLSFIGTPIIWLKQQYLFVLMSFRSFDDVGRNPKFCVSCGNAATKEALFNVDGRAHRKYCDTCAEREVK